MRRRVLTLLSLTAVTVVTGSIAVADGPQVDDIVSAALGPQAIALAVAEVAPTDAAELAPADARVLVARTPQLVERAELIAREPGTTVRASWYGPGFHGRMTANGETFDQDAMTAAHKTLPFGTRLRVTNINNGSSVIVRINDRGPFIPGRSLDLSKEAARQLGIDGVATVIITEL